MRSLDSVSHFRTTVAPQRTGPGDGGAANMPASLTRPRLIREPLKLLQGFIRPLREGWVVGGDGVTDPAPLFPWFPLTSARLLFPDSVEDELELSAVRHRPEGLEQLESQTRFSRKELQILYRGFKNVRDLCLFSSCSNSRLESSRCSRFTLEKLTGSFPDGRQTRNKVAVFLGASESGLGPLVPFLLRRSEWEQGC